ncbi:MAG: zinc ribbon domain-containing protein, partial [Ignisphaera sp.]
SSAPPTAVLIKNEVRCPKCEYNEIYAWQIQTRAADEPPTTFYKCAKCGYTWREY